MPDGHKQAEIGRGVLWVALGRQRVGKTTLLNAAVQHFSALGCNFEVWNADQQNRSHSLSTFFPDAKSPPVGGLIDGRMWVEERLKEQVARRTNAVLDPGGGWTGFSSLVEDIPLVSALGAEGVQVAGLFCVGAERADLDYLEHYAHADLFMPDATMIVCNAGLVLSGQSTSGAFAAVREHPAFRAAVARGAKVAMMPPLGCMSRVTDMGLTFADAADGHARAGQEPLSFLDRARVNRWWRVEMPAFFEQFPEAWLPMPLAHMGTSTHAGS